MNVNEPLNETNENHLNGFNETKRIKLEESHEKTAPSNSGKYFQFQIRN